MATRIKTNLHLYRRSWFRASIGILVACVGLAAAAQMYQRRSAHKLRATGVLELTTDNSGNVTGHIIPITILANGRFYDASIYESRPRPMALENGVVYEAQKSGVAVGYVTIYAGERALGSWLAQGKWQPVTQVAATPPPAAAPVNPGDDRPILHRGGEQPPAQPPQPQDDNRPVLHRKNPGFELASQLIPQPEHFAGEAQDDSDRPVLRRRSPASEPNPSATPIQPAPNSSAPPPAPPRPVLPMTPGTQTLVAISDAQPSENRSFEYSWRPGEEEQLRAKMIKLALAQLPDANSLPNQRGLTNAIMRSFDLDLSNEAVVVFQAEIPGAYLTKGSKTAPGKFISRYITLIARTDVEGNPQRLAVSVTDSSQLDIAPRLEFIDAVDVDGDGLGELLFRQYGADQKSYIIYGVGHGTVTKVFEGATQSLK